MQFIPDVPKIAVLKVPYYEDSKEHDVPGRGVKLTVNQYQWQIMNLLLKLGAGAVIFLPGTYPTEPKRYGFQLQFSLNGIPGRFDIAALPLRSETAVKKDRALAQALYQVGNWLEAEVNSATYRPGAVALVPFLIGAGGKTVTEEMVERGVLVDIHPPMLPGGGS